MIRNTLNFKKRDGEWGECDLKCWSSENKFWKVGTPF